jgi:hypothetical protein
MSSYFLISLFLFISLFAACDRPLRLPYILPELHNWPQPYKGVPGLKLHVFRTATVEVPSKLVYQNNGFLDTHVLDIVVFAIEHRRQGLILVGTGLNYQLAERPERYWGPLLTSLGKPDMDKGQDIVSQLKQAKLPENQVRYLILPDLRLDHTGHIESFPSAKVVVTTAEHNAAIEAGGTRLYLEKEYDAVREWQFIDFAGAQPLGTFHAHRDLFGDGSVVLLDATGATAGGLAVLVRLPSAPVVLSGNLAWTREHYFRTRMPSLLFDRDAWWEKAWRLKKWKELAPELLVLPDHDWATIEATKTPDITLHPFPPREEVKKTEPQPPRKKAGEKGQRTGSIKEKSKKKQKEQEATRSEIGTVSEP